MGAWVKARHAASRQANTNAPARRRAGLGCLDMSDRQGGGGISRRTNANANANANATRGPTPRPTHLHDVPVPRPRVGGIVVGHVERSPPFPEPVHTHAAVVVAAVVAVATVEIGVVLV